MLFMAFDPKKLGATLLSIMESRGISANKIADDLEWSQSTITRITSGETQRPRIDTLMKLAEYLGVTVSQLIGEAPMIEDSSLAEIELNYKAMDLARQRTTLNIIRTIAAEPTTPYKGN